MATELQFIKSASANGDATVSVTDCFSANYDVYKIVINNVVNTGGASAFLRFIDSGGSTITASDYDRAVQGLYSIHSSSSSKGNSTSISSLAFYQTTGGGLVCYVYNPFSSSDYTFVSGQSSYLEINYLAGTKFIGVLKQSASMTGFSLNLTGQTFTTMNISVYGVK